MIHATGFFLYFHVHFPTYFHDVFNFMSFNRRPFVFVPR